MRHAVPLFVILLASIPGAQAQPVNDRAKIAGDSLMCLDRCDAGFAVCLGPPPRRGGPETPIPIPADGRVPTQRPFEECLLERDMCVGQCQIALAEARKKAMIDARGPGSPR